MTPEEFTQHCKDLEHFETPEWAAYKILRREILTEQVLDPCCGKGVLAQFALYAGYNVETNDIYPWVNGIDSIQDFLSPNYKPLYNGVHPFTVFMNPPFSLADKFVDKSFELGARKVVCFQRLAWWESQKRREFWEKTPPNRVYICGDRADCWRHDIPVDKRGSSTPTTHAWFVWEQGQPKGTLTSHIWKSDVEESRV